MGYELKTKFSTEAEVDKVRHIQARSEALQALAALYSHETFHHATANRLLPQFTEWILNGTLLTGKGYY